MTNRVPIGSMFLGPKSENDTFFVDTLLEYIRDHVYWRRNFHPEDPPVITAREAFGEEYRDCHARIVQALFELTSELKSSVPFFSPRYLGHMTSDVMIPGVLGYIVSVLYNPNNVSWEASPITTRLELEVGRQLARMLGYGRTEEQLDRTWGHLTSGGTVANLEALWVARNLKFHPLSIRNAARELGLPELPINGVPAGEASVWQAVNVPVAETLELTGRLYAALAQKEGVPPGDALLEERVEWAIASNSVRHLGIQRFARLFESEGGLPQTVVVLPQTKHYSWMKGPELFGIGTDQVIPVPIDDAYRQDLTRYQEIMARLLEKQATPIMSVVVCGTTEEGAVDQIDRLVALRGQLQQQGLSYYIHCDAAWGGYARSVLLDAEGRMKRYEDLNEYDGWPTRDVYDAFAATGEVDSITIDPHKMGYIPYPAGAVVFKDRRVRQMVTHEAPYALGTKESEARGEIFLGRYIMEGSRPGAAAAAVWLSHEVYPLDDRGYGNLIGMTIRGASYFERALQTLRQTLEGRYQLVVANQPAGLNVVCYFFNPVGNDSLTAMNRFNEMIFEQLSVHPGSRVYSQDYYVSHTEFSVVEYNPEVVRKLLAETEVPPGRLVSEHDKNVERRQDNLAVDDKLTVLRSTIMNPFVLDRTEESNHMDRFVATLPELLDEVRGLWAAES